MNPRTHKIYVTSFFVIGILVTALLAVNGYQYYTTPLEERFFQSQNAMLKPSGVWGHGFGIIGSLMMIIGVAVYMIRKRARKLFNWGFLRHWLELHIFLCTVGPILVLYHTAFKFGGIVAVSFWSMVAVVLSGVVGRFIYVQIPRTIQGQELGMSQLDAINEDLTLKLRNDFSMNEALLLEFENFASPDRYKRLNFSGSLALSFKDYFVMNTILNKFKKEMKYSGISSSFRKEIIKLAKSKLKLTRRIGKLRTMQNLFRYWHIVHLPFAISMFVIMFIHIAVTIIFGYRWIF